MPLGTLGELKAGKLDYSVPFDLVRYVDALVDCKSRYLAEIVVTVGTDGTYPVRAEGERIRLLSVYLFKSFYTFHNKG